MLNGTMCQMLISMSIWKFKLAFLYYFLDPTCLSTNLASQVNIRIKKAYTQKTWAAYKHMFLVFLSFCCYINVDVTHVNVHIVLMFMEFLANNHLSVDSIRNYISAVTRYFKWFELQYEIFNHEKVNIMFRALQRSVSRPPSFKGIFQPQDVINIVNECDKYPWSQMYKTIYLMAYFGFLRISNMVPVSGKQFSLKNIYVEQMYL